MLSPCWAVATVFAVHGSISSSLAARMPLVADHIAVGAGISKPGYALVMPAVGRLLTMPFVGRVVHRIGGRQATLLLISGRAALLPFIALMPSLRTLAAAMFVAGAFAGTVELAMNAEGIAAERELGRSIMPSRHGMWSVGGFLAGGLGWLLAHAHVDGRATFAVSASPWSGWRRGPAKACRRARPTRQSESGEKPPSFALPRGSILVIGLVGFAAVFAEADSADWSAVYLVS
ncbi:hypothetical protein AB0873_30560 [Micromonospora sp. NPDC047707]|uniref:hypothetical protein n=1 Tax=Micromonospora sp. NPDC047707 TaxID=3154498 RepID=UPI003454CA72